MHLGNEAITPACAAITFAAASVGLGMAVISARAAGLDRRRMATAGLLGAAVFAAQMINVPVLPFASAHLVGGVLLAWVIGPGLGTLVMALILATQAMMGDGGMMALGANVINMALLPAALVSVVQPRLAAARAAVQYLGAGAVAGLAVFLAAALIVGQVALFRSGAELAHLSTFASQMLGTHALIALGEGLVTAGILGLLATGAVPSRATSSTLGVARLAGIGIAAALLLALSPLSSSIDDGYEAAMDRSGMAQAIESSIAE